MVERCTPSEVLQGAVVQRAVSRFEREGPHGLGLRHPAGDIWIDVTDMNHGRDCATTYFHIGQSVSVRVIAADVDRQLIRGGIFQSHTSPSPWRGVSVRLRPGDRVCGVVDHWGPHFGFITLSDGLSAYLHAEEPLPAGTPITAAVEEVRGTVIMLSLDPVDPEPDPWSQPQTGALLRLIFHPDPGRQAQGMELVQSCTEPVRREVAGVLLQEYEVVNAARCAKGDTTGLLRRFATDSIAWDGGPASEPDRLARLGALHRKWAWRSAHGWKSRRQATEDIEIALLNRQWTLAASHARSTLQPERAEAVFFRRFS